MGRREVIFAGGVVLVAAVAAAASANSLPSPVPPVRLAQEIQYLDKDIVLDPVQPDFVPVVSADQAVSAASKQEDLSGASRIQLMLAALTMPDFRPVDPKTDEPIGPPLWVKVPVWDVIADGVCVAGSAGPRRVFSAGDSAALSPDPCPFTEAQIFINALSGEVMLEAGFPGSS